MAAGCRVVTTRLGALPETCAGFARLVPAMPADSAEFGKQFSGQVIQTLREIASDRDRVEEELRHQVAHANRNSVWTARAKQWLEWLKMLAAQK